MIYRHFFKLPLIFMTIVFVTFWGLRQATMGLLYGFDMSVIMPPDFVDTTIGMSFPLFIYFMVTVFCCDKYRLYSPQKNALSIVIFIAVIFSIFLIGFILLLHFPLEIVYYPLREWVPDSYKWLVKSLCDLIVYSINAVMLIGLFRLCCQKNTMQRQAYSLEGQSSKHVYTVMYSVLMLAMYCCIFLPLFYRDPFLALHYYFDVPLLLILLIVVVAFILHYLFVFYSVRQCFKCVDNELKLLPLLKSVGLAMVFSVVSFIILDLIIRFIIHKTLFSAEFTFVSSFLVSFGLFFYYGLFFIAIRKGASLVFGKKGSESKRIARKS